MSMCEDIAIAEAGVDISQRVLFVYAKDGRIQCLSLNEARVVGPSLVRDGWKHTATLDPKHWIESLCEVFPREALAKIAELCVGIS